MLSNQPTLAVESVAGLRLFQVADFIVIRIMRKIARQAGLLQTLPYELSDLRHNQ
jgi:hypothetical protein